MPEQVRAGVASKKSNSQRADREAITDSVNGNSIWRRLVEGGACDGVRSRVLNEIEARMGDYERGLAIAPQASKETQLKDASELLDAIENLDTVIERIDRSIRNRLHRQMAPKDCEGKRLEAGRARVARELSSMRSAAEFAFERAKVKRSGRGKKQEDAALHALVVELAKIWERVTDKPFRAGRKKGGSSEHKPGASRRFIEAVLVNGLALSLKDEYVTTRVKAAQKEIKRLKARSEESEASENELGDGN